MTLRASIGLILGLAACAARGQTAPPIEFGYETLSIPPVIVEIRADPRTVRLLTDALAAEQQVERRVQFVIDLGACRDAAAAPAIARAMHDPSPEVRGAAAMAAEVSGDASLLPALAALCADSDPAVRRQALRAAGAIGDPAIIAAGLRDPEETVFAAACAFSSTTGHDELIAGRLGSLKSEAAKVAGIAALGRRSAADHQAIVAERLGDSLPVQNAAIQSLGQMAAAARLPEIEKFLSHAHPTLRRSAIEAIGRMADADTQVRLALPLLEDTDPTVSAAAARLLEAHPRAEAVGAILRQLSRRHPALHDAARAALLSASRAGIGQVDSAIAAMLRDSDPLRREDASFMLGELATTTAFDDHLRLLEDADWRVVKQAAVSMGKIGRADAAPRLMRLIERAQNPKWQPDEPPAISAALIACARLGHQPALAAARRVIGDVGRYPGEIRTAACWAIGVLASPADTDLARELLAVARSANPYELPEVRFEALKAIANMRPPALLSEMQAEAAGNPLPDQRWAAHQAVERITGRSRPYAPPRIVEVPPTSIQSTQP